MSKVTIELSEYNDLRDRYKKKCAEAKNLKSEIETLKQEQAKQIEELQQKGKVAVMLKVNSAFDFMLPERKPTLESVANLDDVKEEVKAYFLENEKVKLLDEKVDELKKTVQKPLEELSDENAKLKATLENIKSLPWWKRLFNKF